jgi:mRNA interferase MazF
MNTGDIILLPFPFAELTNIKVRPSVIVCETRDKYKDLVVCAISSVVPPTLGENEFLLQPNAVNKLRAVSVVKVDRIVTLKSRDVIARIGKLETESLATFIEKFKQLVD